MQKYINVDPAAVRTGGVLHESDSLLFSSSPSSSLHEREDLENSSSSSSRGYPDTTAGRTSNNSPGHFSGINPLNKAAFPSGMGSIFIQPSESSPPPVSSSSSTTIIPSTSMSDGLSMNPLQSPSQPILSPGGMMVQPASIVSSSEQRSSDKARKSLKEPKTVRYK